VLSYDTKECFVEDCALSHVHVPHQSIVSFALDDLRVEGFQAPHRAHLLAMGVVQRPPGLLIEAAPLNALGLHLNASDALVLARAFRLGGDERAARQWMQHQDLRPSNAAARLHSTRFHVDTPLMEGRLLDAADTLAPLLRSTWPSPIRASLHAQAGEILLQCDAPHLVLQLSSPWLSASHCPYAELSAHRLLSAKAYLALGQPQAALTTVLTLNAEATKHRQPRWAARSAPTHAAALLALGQDDASDDVIWQAMRLPGLLGHRQHDPPLRLAMAQSFARRDQPLAALDALHHLHRKLRHLPRSPLRHRAWQLQRSLHLRLSQWPGAQRAQQALDRHPPEPTDRRHAARTTLTDLLGLGRASSQPVPRPPPRQRPGAHRPRHQSKTLPYAVVAKATHEIRTPLQGIVGMCEQLESLASEAPVRELLRMIQSTALHAADVVSELNQYSRLAGGRLRPQPTSTPLLPWIREVEMVATLGRATPHPALEVRMGELPETATFDPKMHRQVLLNLLDNALKYAPAHSTVRWTIQFDGSTLLYIVEDHGPGIPQGMVQRIFEPFHRLATHEAHEGSGLGLSILRELVHLLNGKVTVNSSADQGTRFAVALPVPKPLPSRPRPAPLLPMKVLVIEDDTITRHLAKRLLGRLHMGVVATSTLTEALAHLTDDGPDVILLDVHLPEGEGAHLVQLLRRRTQAPIVLTTGATEAKLLDACLGAGAQLVVRKPYQSAAIEAALRSIQAG